METDYTVEELVADLVSKYLGVYMGEEEEEDHFPVYSLLLGGLHRDPGGYTYKVQILGDGINLNLGWLSTKDRFGNELAAKSMALELCTKTGVGVTRVLRLGMSAKTLCAFFKEEGKVYIVVPVVKGKKVVNITQELYYPSGMGVTAPIVTIDDTEKRLTEVP